MSVVDFIFYSLGAVCAYLAYKTNPFKQAPESSPSFVSFQRNYVFVFLVMMGSDWLQGPYVYALYASYGYAKEEISTLFIAGFGASMVFGTIVGSFGDTIGRKKTCILFGILYTLSCFTKHFSNFYVLMLGRLLGGVATSLLFSVFEAWMVCEHNEQRFAPSLLGGTFSQAYFCNSIVAISAGLVGQWAARTFSNGEGDNLVAPFDCAAILLTIGTTVVALTWMENYGNKTSPFLEQMQMASTVIVQNQEVVIAGACQSLFEGAMYTFVFMWTMSLEAAAERADMGPIPHGYIFSCFMVSCMIGSCLFKYLSAKLELTSLLSYVVGVAALGLLPAAIGAEYFGFTILMIGFCVFEGAVGCYWPLIGEIRSAVIPEECRSTIMNFFRVPLNLIVVIVLFNISKLSNQFVFRFCVTLLGVSAYLATILHIPVGKRSKAH
eukprot:jgi/Bigna1/90905/estExt_fgenesh1_pg.C_820058